MTRTARLLAFGLIAASGCRGSLKPEAEAFCSDLRSGVSPLQIYEGVRDQYTPNEFAAKTFWLVSIGCPTELKSNVGLRSFLDAAAIDPDRMYMGV